MMKKIGGPVWVCGHGRVRVPNPIPRGGDPSPAVPGRSSSCRRLEMWSSSAVLACCDCLFELLNIPPMIISEHTY